MNITSLARLLNAQLLNEPSISSVSSFCVSLSKVSRGSAFFALEDDDSVIKAAENSGAYAIISANITPKNGEIAYLKVSNMRQAMLRFLRFFASDKGIKFMLATPLELCLLPCLNTKSKALCATNMQELFTHIINSKGGEVIFASDATLLEGAGDGYLRVGMTDFKLLKSSSIFTSSFISDGVFYGLVGLSAIFAPELAALLASLKELDIEFRLTDFRNFEHFEPVFVNANMSVAEFGSSERVLIAESDVGIFELASNRLSSIANDAILWRGSASEFVKIAMGTINEAPKPSIEKELEPALFSPAKSAEQIAAQEAKEALTKRIMQKDFRYVLINSSKDELLNALENANKKMVENSLF